MKFSEREKQIYIQSNLLLKHKFTHAFYTKTSTKESPKLLIKQHNKNSNVFQIDQVHSKKVVDTSEDFFSPWPKADGIIGKEKNQSLWIYTADCLPILFADKKKRNVAACHAGLKGIRDLIIKEVIEKLYSIGTNSKDIIIAIGPAISGSKYQVSLEDAELVIKTISKKEKFNISKRKNNPLQNIPKFDFLQKDPTPQRVLLDIATAAKTQLIEMSIKEDQIDLISLCTFSNPNLFNSWRRDKKKQYQWSFISS